MAIGDFDGDGRADLAVANKWSDTVGVLLGQVGGTFAAAATYSSGGSHPVSVAIGDVNGDGRADLAVANASTDTVGVLLGQASRTFGAAATYSSGGSGPTSVAIGDFDGDGRADLAVANEWSGTVGVLLGQVGGTFGAAATYSSGGNAPQSVVIGDLNGDGRADLAAANVSSDTVGVLLGQEWGTFAAVATYTSGGSSPIAVAIGDLDGDGRADLAVANLGDTVGVLLGQAGGAFAAAVTYSSGGDVAASMAIGDLNGDGRADLAVVNLRSNTVGVLLGQVGGTFAAATTYSSGGNSPQSVAIGDLDGDGRADLAVANGESDTVGVLLAQADGTFAAATTYSSGGIAPERVAIGDLNGDGRADLAVVNHLSGTVGILLGQAGGKFAAPATYSASGSRSLAIGDLNGDGRADLAVANANGTVEVLLSQAGGTLASPATYGSGSGDDIPYSVAIGDLNGDGLADLAAVNELSGSVGVLLGPPGALALPLFLPLFSSNSRLFDVQLGGFMAGQLVHGSQGAFDGLNRLQVDGVDYAPPALPPNLQNSARTLVLPPQTIAGLTVSREITVPDTGSEDFARTVDVFENSSGSSITTTVRLVGNLGSDAATTVFNTSDGDTTLEPSDQWIGTDDGDGTGTPAIIHYLHGSGSNLQPTSVVRTGDNIEWTYQLTVPTGATVRLAHFTILADTRAAAETAARVLVTPTGFGGQAAAFLGQTELDSLANFDFAPLADIVDVSPDPRDTAVSAVDILFSVAVSGFDLADLQLTRDGSSNLLTAAQTLTTSDSITWTLGNLTGLTDTVGSYVLGLTAANSGIRDAVGNALTTDASDAWTMDTTALRPVITGTTPSFATSGTLGEGTMSLQISFSEPVVGADLPANYQLQSLGPDALLGTADDTLVAISVSYADTTAVLNFSPLPASVYRLTVHATITDTAGNPLDGDANGTAGGDWMSDFVVIPTGGDLFCSTPTYSSGGGYPVSVAVGDLNGDGRADLAIANNDSNTVGVLLSQAGGTFAAATTYGSGGNAPRSVAIRDLNGDGRVDLAVANSDSNTVGVLLGQVGGTLAAAATYSSGGNYPISVAIGDLNGDGREDLAVANLGDTVGILLGQADGTFAAATTYNCGNHPVSVAIGDLNGDGRADLAVANMGSNNVGVLFGQAGGNFAATATYSFGVIYPVSVAIGDLNGDGRADLAVVNMISNFLEVLLRQAGGTFAATATYDSGGSDPISVAIGDLNGDGRADLAVANYDGNNVVVLENTAAFAQFSSHGLLFDVQTGGVMAGQLVNGSHDAFDGLNRLQVGAVDYAPTSQQLNAQDDMRTLILPAQTIGGLSVHREITVPNVGGEDFARTVEVFQNSTASPISTTVRITGNLGSDNATTVWATSDGDTAVETTDQWIGTVDADGTGAPAIINYIHGPAGLQPTLVRLSGNRGDNIEWTYSLTVLAGQTVRLTHFTILADTRAAAMAAADALVTATDFGGQAAAYLTPAELASLANFQFPQSLLAKGIPGTEVSGKIAGQGEDVLTVETLEAVKEQSLARWAAAGLDSNGLSLLKQVQFQIVELPDFILGLESPQVIWLDQDAVGFGWFVDQSSADDVEFSKRSGGIGIGLDATAASPAEGGVDLLTVITHELGHVLGLGHIDDLDDLMQDVLGAGTRRLPSASDVDLFFAQKEIRPDP
ncbi:MAG: FG-GAP-like repeat-containing protein [Planctomycetota bacterium]|nr:FG-GAP-like repeat-containing protein [Planctomycetota bacterium]